MNSPSSAYGVLTFWTTSLCVSVATMAEPSGRMSKNRPHRTGWFSFLLTAKTVFPIAVEMSPPCIVNRFRLSGSGPRNSGKSPAWKTGSVDRPVSQVQRSPFSSNSIVNPLDGSVFKRSIKILAGTAALPSPSGLSTFRMVLSLISPSIAARVSSSPRSVKRKLDSTGRTGCAGITLARFVRPLSIASVSIVNFICLMSWF